MIIWIYRFEDGTKLELLNVGLSTAELMMLRELHGGYVVDWRRM